MAQDFKIEQVSSRAPEEFNTAYGTLEKYRIMLPGYSEAITINKKPGNRPKAGDVIYGTVENTTYGLKFNSESRPEYAGKDSKQSTSRASYQPRDDKAIQAQFAIKAAIATVVPSYEKGTVPADAEIESWAHDYMAMIERVKIGSDPAPYPESDSPPPDVRSDGTYPEPGDRDWVPDDKDLDF